MTAVKVSVLCPTRKRAASLAVSVNGLLDLAGSPGEVEVLVATDPDDTGIYVGGDYGDGGRVWIWQAPERYGYARLHEYYNALAKMAAGEWLLIWNDDARMVTPGWDAIIAARQPGVLWLGANHHHSASMFPAWPKAWADALGYVSPVAHCDTYLQYLGEGLGGLVKVPVEVLHDRADVTGGHDDATYAEGRGRIGPHGMVDGFDGPAVRAQVVQDVLTIERLGAVRMLWAVSNEQPKKGCDQWRRAPALAGPH